MMEPAQDEKGDMKHTEYSKAQVMERLGGKGFDVVSWSDEDKCLHILGSGDTKDLAIADAVRNLPKRPLTESEMPAAPPLGDEEKVKSLYPTAPVDTRGADRMVQAIVNLVHLGRLDSRSEASDAALDYVGNRGLPGPTVSSVLRESSAPVDTRESGELAKELAKEQHIHRCLADMLYNAVARAEKSEAENAALRDALRGLAEAMRWACDEIDASGWGTGAGDQGREALAKCDALLGGYK